VPRQAERESLRRVNGHTRRSGQKSLARERLTQEGNSSLVARVGLSVDVMDDFGDNIPVSPKELEVIETYLSDLLGGEDIDR
jgi:hypothetical protein